MSDQLLPVLVAVLAGVLGMPVARWLRRATYRKPDEESMPLPGSRWWVVPVLATSAGLLTWRVLVIDVPTDPGAALGRAWVVDTIVLLTLLALALSCVSLSAMDLDVHRLPDRIMWPTMAAVTTGVVLAGAVAGDWVAPLRAIGTGLGCGLAFFLLSLLALARGSLAFGLGDVKLSVVLGTALGWFGVLTAVIGMYGGLVVGALVALVLMVSRRAGPRDDFAYGPPMVVGALLGLLVGPDVLF